MNAVAKLVCCQYFAKSYTAVRNSATAFDNLFLTFYFLISHICIINLFSIALFQYLTDLDFCVKLYNCMFVFRAMNYATLRMRLKSNGGFSVPVYLMYYFISSRF